LSEPKLTELLETTRQLYVGLSEYRIGSTIEENEVESTEEAQKSAATIVADLNRMIGARKAKAEQGA